MAPDSKFTTPWGKVNTSSTQELNERVEAMIKAVNTEPTSVNKEPNLTRRLGKANKKENTECNPKAKKKKEALKTPHPLENKYFIPHEISKPSDDIVPPVSPKLGENNEAKKDETENVYESPNVVVVLSRQLSDKELYDVAENIDKEEEKEKEKELVSDKNSRFKTVVKAHEVGQRKY